MVGQWSWAKTDTFMGPNKYSYPKLRAWKRLNVHESGSGGIEKSHSCKWAKWIQWHALPHIQQSTQQWNKRHYPYLHGWDFSIPPSPRIRRELIMDLGRGVPRLFKTRGRQGDSGVSGKGTQEWAGGGLTETQNGGSS